MIFAFLNTCICFFLSKISGFTINDKLSYTGCYNRTLVNFMNSSDVGLDNMRLLLASAGFSSSVISSATHKCRSFASIKHRLCTIIDTIGSVPYRLLHLAAWLSLWACLASVIYLLYIFSVLLFVSHIQPGWITTVLTQSIFLGILFFVLFVFSCVFASQVGKKKDDRFAVARDISKSECITLFNELNLTDKE